MSKEQDFHKQIIEQNQEEKDSLWRKIEQQQDEEVVELGEVLGKKHRLSQKAIIIVSSFVCLLIGIAIILACTLTIKKEDAIRYCGSDDYYLIDFDGSIEKYAEDNGKELLFFDWYAESEYYTDIQYRLKTTNEVICLREELVDENGVYIVQNITDKYTQLDFLNFYYTNCNKSTKIESCEIKYGIADSKSYAYFSFKKHNYYLLIEALADEQYILKLVEDLIK